MEECVKIFTMKEFFYIFYNFIPGHQNLKTEEINYWVGWQNLNMFGERSQWKRDPNLVRWSVSVIPCHHIKQLVLRLT